VTAFLIVGVVGAIIFRPRTVPAPAPREPTPAPAVAPEPEPVRKVLTSSLPGRWYEADPERLASELKGYLDEAERKDLAPVRALILPHAGYRYSGRAAACAVKQVAGRTFSRVVVLGPSHRLGLRNVASVPAATHYATPLGEVPLDVAFLRALRRHPVFQCIPPAHAREHSVQIEVPLLQQALGQFRLVPIVVGDLDAETSRAMARILLGLIDQDTLVVASSDFTHFGPNYRYEPFHENVAANIERLDMGAFATIRERDDEAFRSYIEETGATICGRCAVGVLLAMVGPEAEAHLLCYDTSGRQGGSYTNSVSYLAIAFRGGWPEAAPVAAPPSPPLEAADRRRLVTLARQTLVHALAHRRYPTPEQLGVEITAPLRRPRGAFVSLHRGEHLRGCRGQIHPTTPLFQTVMVQVVQSALFDHRFPQVRADEVAALRITISVLTPPRPVGSAREIVLGKHGIILDKDGHSALYLPQVAPEQGWDLAQTLGHLARKAGLPETAWQEGASFTVFEAEVFGEAER
jgi:AmmeMemoRadiSam system protein B/AmmeMemoRadiSam system protein A